MPRRNKAKKVWNILSLSALMAFLGACQKDPTPQPQPEPTPIIPTKEITIHWNWDANIGWAPPMDTIKYYTDQDSVKFVDINIIGDKGIGFPVNCGGCTPMAFNIAHNMLQTRIDIDSSKVKLSGTILINPHNGATLQDPTNNNEPGMAYSDSVWFTHNGCTVRRPIYTK